VSESRVNARGQTRVRFAAGWTSVTSADGATLLEPIDAVESDPQLYRVLNRVTIRVGADTVRRAPHGARAAHAPHARVSQASSQVGALEVGEFVTVLETRTLPNGQLRARFQYTLQKTRLGRDGGWTSVTTSDGERMMGAACPRNWLPARSRRSRRAVQSASKTERLACLRAFLRGGPLPRNLLCRS